MMSPAVDKSRRSRSANRIRFLLLRKNPNIAVLPSKVLILKLRNSSPAIYTISPHTNISNVYFINKKHINYVFLYNKIRILSVVILQFSPKLYTICNFFNPHFNTFSSALRTVLEWLLILSPSTQIE